MGTEFIEQVSFAAGPITTSKLTSSTRLAGRDLGNFRRSIGTNLTSDLHQALSQGYSVVSICAAPSQSLAQRSVVSISQYLSRHSCDAPPRILTVMLPSFGVAATDCRDKPASRRHASSKINCGLSLHAIHAGKGNQTHQAEPIAARLDRNLNRGERQNLKPRESIWNDHINVDIGLELYWNVGNTLYFK